MHELSLCRSIFEIIHQTLAKNKFQRVKKITIVLGQLASVEKSALTLAFDVMKQGTFAEDAELVYIEAPGQAVCDHCHQTVLIRQYYDPCHVCGQYGLTVVQGETLQIQSMEVE